MAEGGIEAALLVLGAAERDLRRDPADSTALGVRGAILIRLARFWPGLADPGRHFRRGSASLSAALKSDRGRSPHLPEQMRLRFDILVATALADLPAEFERAGEALAGFQAVCRDPQFELLGTAERVQALVACCTLHERLGDPARAGEVFTQACAIDRVLAVAEYEGRKAPLPDGDPAPT